jgi:hypothetical protein
VRLGVPIWLGPGERISTATTAAPWLGTRRAVIEREGGADILSPQDEVQVGEGLLRRVHVQ